MASLPQFERKGIRTSTPQPVNPEGVRELRRDKYSAGPALKMKRYRMLVARAVDAFGDEVKASRWLSLPSLDFNGQTPLQVAQNSGYDLKVIEPILIRIEHGVAF
jgi:uncharacterized protein (DUF2384 family)